MCIRDSSEPELQACAEGAAMTGISLERFAQVGLGEKVGFAGNDKTSLETRPASKGFCGRVAGWVQNQFTSHRAEKREVMGAFLQALRAEYDQVVGDAAFRHAVGDRTTH